MSDEHAQTTWQPMESEMSHTPETPRRDDPWAKVRTYETLYPNSGGTLVFRHYAATEVDAARAAVEHQHQQAQAAKDAEIEALKATNQTLNRRCQQAESRAKLNEPDSKSERIKARDERIDQLEADLATARAEIEALKAEIATDDALLADRQRILDACPCPVHGSCVPHILSQLNELATARAALAQQAQALKDALDRMPEDRIYTKRFIEVDEAAGSTYELVERDWYVKARALVAASLPPTSPEHGESRT